MVIYLIRNTDLSKSRFNKILSILNFNGNKKKVIIQYIGVCVDSTIDEDVVDINNEDYTLPIKRINEEELNPRFSRDFSRYFKICDVVREREKIDENAICILLTNELNQNNFFTWCDHKIKNIFVQTSQWELVFEGEMKYDYAVMYEINAWVLRSFFFEDSTNLKRSINRRVKGDLMDLCHYKDEMSNKMKTAEIPEHLLNELTENNIDKYPYVKYIKEQFEKIRLMLLNRDDSNFWNFPVTLRFTHNNDKRCVVVEEMGNKPIDFELTDRVIYRFLLSKNEGIHYDNFQLYKKEIYDLFCIEKSLNTTTKSILKSMKNKLNISFTNEERVRYSIIIDDVDINEIETDKPKALPKSLFNSRVSSINSALDNIIPSGIVENYHVINFNQKNKYRIDLDRNLVKYDK